MHRCLYPATLCTLVLALALPACGGTGPAAAGAPTAGESFLCAVGNYAGTGVDEEGTTWSFTFALRQEGQDLVGTFEWSGSNGAVGEERVRGRVDCTSGRFEWSGEAASGGSETVEIVTAEYSGRFTEDFGGFSGSWVGGSPGTLSGERR